MICCTVGHSNLEITRFISLIKKHGINCVVDVRSTPFSEFNPQFNRDNLKDSLEKTVNLIQYLYIGNLGGRYTNPDLLFDDGTVDYERVSTTSSFIQGIHTLVDRISENKNIAIMCAEKDPSECHRAILIAPSLVKKGIEVKHILHNSNIITHQYLEEMLLKKYCKDYHPNDLFPSKIDRSHALENAYRVCNHEIAYMHKVKEIS
jgi:uncharacterized protein (DUF488 family)